MLSLITWNLDGLEPRWLDERAEAACLHLLLRPDPPDIVALQEVVDRTWHAHLTAHFGHAGYVGVPGRAESGYWVALFVRKPLVVREAHLHPLPGTHMGRALLDVRIAWGDRDLRVLTSHLESLKCGGPSRRLQLAHALERLVAHDGPAVFCGDTNLRDRETEHLPLLDRVSDAWVQVGRPAAHRFTWDTGRIPNKRRGRRARLRFDRVFLNAHLRATALDLVGEVPLAEAGGWFPSDHLGVRVHLL